MARGDLTQQEWERLAPLLPPEKGARGRPAQAHRRVLNGILFRLRTGIPWRDLPERYGSWKTCHSRLRRWQAQGVWQRLLQALQAEADAAGTLDWEHVALDSTTVRAHQHAAGARRSRPVPTGGDEKGGGPASFRSAGTEPRRLDDQTPPRR
jgi:transposase